MNFPLRSVAAARAGITGWSRRASVSNGWVLLAALFLLGTAASATAQTTAPQPAAAHSKDAHAAAAPADSNQASAEGEPESTPDFDLAQLQQLLKREHPSTAEFTEKQYRKVLSKPVESKGILRFQPPNVFERQVLTPRAEKYRIVGETLVMETPGRKVRKVSLRSQPLLRALLVGFQAVVSGDLTLLAPYYQIAASGSPEEWHLELDPTDSEVARYVERIAIDGRQRDALHFEIRQRNGDRLVTDIKPKT